jgi:mannitol/fructose-specific phosphotransferase system IIA component (Ntr-type)
MRLKDFLDPLAVRLGMAATVKDAALEELVAALGLDARRAESVVRILRRREQLGSTGVGRGIAIPHGRSLAVNRLQLAFGTQPAGIDYQAIDGRPVHALFLIVAPPLEVANQYLPVLGRIAQFAREPDVPERLKRLQSPEELFALLHEKGA